MKFITFTILMILAGVCIYLLEGYYDIPVVYWSQSQNECVKVIYEDIAYDCTEIPEKYTKVWVK